MPEQLLTWFVFPLRVDCYSVMTTLKCNRADTPQSIFCEKGCATDAIAKQVNVEITSPECPVAFAFAFALIRVRKISPKSGVNKSARERIGRQNLSQKVPSKKGSLGVTHTQNLQILREDALGATCSAGPFCLLPTKFSCIKFFQIRDVPTQIPGHPGHSLSKTTKRATCIKFLSGISRRLGPGCPRNIPPKNFMFRLFFGPD